MPKDILIDEFHLTVLAPCGLEETEYLAIRQTLDSRRFRADLRRALREVCRREPSLSKARIRLTR